MFNKTPFTYTHTHTHTHTYTHAHTHTHTHTPTHTHTNTPHPQHLLDKEEKASLTRRLHDDRTLLQKRFDDLLAEKTILDSRAAELETSERAMRRQVDEVMSDKQAVDKLVLDLEAQSRRGKEEILQLRKKVIDLGEVLDKETHAHEDTVARNKREVAALHKRLADQAAATAGLKDHLEDTVTKLQSKLDRKEEVGMDGWMLEVVHVSSIEELL